MPHRQDRCRLILLSCLGLDSERISYCPLYGKASTIESHAAFVVGNYHHLSLY